jgi:hypothetical protein
MFPLWTKQIGTAFQIVGFDTEVDLHLWMTRNGKEVPAESELIRSLAGVSHVLALSP